MRESGGNSRIPCNEKSGFPDSPCEPTTLGFVSLDTDFFLFRLLMVRIVVDHNNSQQAWRRPVQAIIAVFVVMGLAWAARSASQHWSEETRAIEQKLADVQFQMSQTSDANCLGELQEVAKKLDRQIPRLSNLRWNRLLMAGLLYAIGLLPSAIVLRTNASLFGKKPGWGTSVTAQLLGHLGKYVPGKAMVIVIRAGVLKRDQVTLMAATASVFAETFLMMAVGSAIAGMVTFALPVPPWIVGMAIVMTVAATLPTIPPVMRMAVRKVSQSSTIDTQGINLRWWIQSWGWTALSWCFIGASFTAIITAIPGATPLPPWQTLYGIATAAIGLAMVAGFASLLPGGAGVRELVLITILSLSIDPTHGVLAAIAARLVFVAVEMVLGILSWLWLRRRRWLSDTMNGSGANNHDQVARFLL